MRRNSVFDDLLDWVSDNRIMLLFVFISLLICIIRFFLVSDGRFFIIGDDSRRHLAVINSFIENRAIVFPQSSTGGYAAYIYYAPLFHIIIAVLSIVSGIPAIAIQNITPLFFLVAFFFLSYKLLRLFFEDKKTPMMTAMIALFFLPLPAPNPHDAVYYILLPLALYFIIRIFDYPRLRNFAGLFVTTLLIGLMHAQSMAFYFVSLTVTLFFGALFFNDTKHTRALALAWIVSAIAYVDAFFLFSFITPTFWEAILHYFSITLASEPTIRMLEQVYLSTGPNKFFVIGVFFAVPLVIFGLLYVSAQLIQSLKESASRRISDAIRNVRLPGQSRHLWLLPFAIIGLTAVYFLLINIFFTLFEIVSVFIFQPALPYFARIKAIYSLADIAMLSRYGFEVMAVPYYIGVTVLVAATIYSVVYLFKEKAFSEKPGALVMLGFMLPLYFGLFTFPLINLSKYVSSLIIDRFSYYIYPSLVFFLAPIVLAALDYVKSKRGEGLKRFVPFVFVSLILVLTMVGPLYTASYSVNPVQNAGYEWLVKNTPVKEDAPQLNFDILGYYHISNFPFHYAIQFFGYEPVAIDLVRKDLTYTPVIKISLLGFETQLQSGIYWAELPVRQGDQKIYDNPEISFYYSGV